MNMNRFKVRLRKSHLLTFLLCGVLFVVVLVAKIIKWKPLQKDQFSSVSQKVPEPGNFRDPTPVSPMSHKVIMRRFPFVRDPDCHNFSMSLYEDSTFDLTGLVSFPGSGNTWTRHLIQMASGVYTGSVYFDLELYAGGFVGEKEDWYSGRTIVQKFHDKFQKNMYLEKAILLIREPFPAIMSYANYIEGGHTGNAFRLPYHHKDWPNFLLHSAYNWLSLAKSWIEAPVNLLVIHYEDLRSQPVANVKIMCEFLNHSCPHLGSPCFKRKLEGSFKRAQTSTLKDATRQSRYPSGISDVVSRGIDHLNQLLYQNGLQPVPLKLYKYYMTPPPTVPVNKSDGVEKTLQN